MPRSRNHKTLLIKIMLMPRKSDAYTITHQHRKKKSHILAEIITREREFSKRKDADRDGSRIFGKGGGTMGVIFVT